MNISQILTTNNPISIRVNSLYIKEYSTIRNHVKIQQSNSPYRTPSNEKQKISINDSAPISVKVGS
jgi:hypothetical protein